jgi:hypothetical protein
LAEEEAFRIAGTAETAPIRSLDVLKRKPSGEYFVDLFDGTVRGKDTFSSVNRAKSGCGHV